MTHIFKIRIWHFCLRKIASTVYCIRRINVLITSFAVQRRWKLKSQKRTKPIICVRSAVNFQYYMLTKYHYFNLMIKLINFKRVFITKKCLIICVVHFVSTRKKVENIILYFIIMFGLHFSVQRDYFSLELN